MTGKLGSLGSLAGVPLHKAMENTGVGLICCDADGRLTLLSPRLQELFGIDFEPHEEESLPTVFRLFRADGVTPMPSQEMPIARARAGHYVRDEVVAVRNGAGELVYLECNGFPLENDDGSSAGAFVLAHDVTAEHTAALLTEDLRARLVQMVNHEFRTPLAALLGHVQEISNHHDDVPPDLASALAAIERAGWRLSDLVCAAVSLIEREEQLHRGGRTPDGAPLVRRVS